MSDARFLGAGSILNRLYKQTLDYFDFGAWFLFYLHNLKRSVVCTKNVFKFENVSIIQENDQILLRFPTYHL